jgi:PAS domain S-box-containing protein
MANPDYRKTLRPLAEEPIRQSRSFEELSSDGLRALVREFELRQAELRLQNEELLELTNELEAARDRFRDLFDFAPSGCLTLGDDGVIREANVMASELLGYDRTNLLGQRIRDLIEPGCWDRFDLHQKTVAETGGPLTCELRFRTAKRRGRDLRFESMVIGDTDPSVRVSLVDVSDRVAAESALRDANRKLASTADSRRAELDERWRLTQAIADALPLALWILDLDTDTASYFNAAASGLLGCDPAVEHRANLTIEGIVDPLDLHRFRRAVASIGSDGRNVVEVSFRVMSSLGERRWLSSRLAAFTRDPDGRVTRVVCASGDVTDLRRAEERVQQLRQEAAIARQRERRDLAVMLHDSIGQLLPLSTMKLALARRSCDEATRLQLIEVERLLVEAHSAATSLTYRLSPLELGEIGLVAAVEGLVREVARDQDLRVVLHQDVRDTRLADALEFAVYRTIRELLANVGKHAQTRDVVVELTHQGNELSVVVEDHGVGFVPDPTRNWGWGLRSARERLDYLGGRLHLHSAPGCGTRVEMRVPIHSTDTQEAQ